VSGGGKEICSSPTGVKLYFNFNTMGLLSEQPHISGKLPQPSENAGTKKVATATTEAVVWFFISSAAYAAAVGEAAGTICTGKLAYTGVLNSMNTALGNINDTSLSWGAATRVATLVDIPESVFSNIVGMTPTDQVAEITGYLSTAGDYAIDHRRGQIWMNAKDTVVNDAATYDYFNTISPVA